MIRNHQESIGYLLWQLVSLESETKSGWNDDNSRRFFHSHLNPLKDNLNRYNQSVCKYMDSLDEAMRKINSLVGSAPSIYPSDFQRERER